MCLVQRVGWLVVYWLQKMGMQHSWHSWEKRCGRSFQPLLVANSIKFHYRHIKPGCHSHSFHIACSWTRTKKSFAEMTGPKRGPIPRPTSRYQKQLVWFYERCTIHIILHISCVHVYILILCITKHITHTYMLINSHHQWHMTKDDQRTWKSQHSQRCRLLIGTSLPFEDVGVHTLIPGSHIAGQVVTPWKLN